MVSDHTAAAFCPGHISGYFRRVAGRDSARTGSTGAGIVISSGVVARVRPAERTSIEIYREEEAGNPIRIARDSPPVRYAMDRMGAAAAVTTTCSLPIGAGFGLSAAALLATLTALNRLNRLGMSERQIAHAAHEAEIVHRTGLGDVVSCRGGGMVVRTIAGIDAPVQRFLNLNRPLFAVSFGPIPTPAVLSSRTLMDRIAAAYPADKPVGIDHLFSLSRDFARRSGLITPQVREVFAACDRMGVAAGMTMLGNGVFAYGENARGVLSRFGRVYSMTVARHGPLLLEGR